MTFWLFHGKNSRFNIKTLKTLEVPYVPKPRVPLSQPHLRSPQGKKAGVEVETVEKDLDSLGDEAQRAAIQRDAPELQALLAELRHNLAEVRGRIGPLIKEVSWGKV